MLCKSKILIKKFFPGPEDRFNRLETEIARELHEKHQEERRLLQIKAEFEEEELRLNQEARNAISERQMLERRRNVRLEWLKKNEPDTYRGMMWLKDHKHLFRGRVYNPMLLEINVPNPEMAKYVEARISYRDLIGFTCTSPEDLNLLIDELRTKQNLKVNCVNSDDDSTQYQPDVPMSQLR